MSSSKKISQSICWDCKNAVKPHVCPWMDDYTPVKGWTARKMKVGTPPYCESYLVTACPLFKRDGYEGGTITNHFGTHERIKPEEDEIVELAEAIVERAVEDWKYLEYGQLSKVRCHGDLLERDELLCFFFSGWFNVLLQSFSERNPSQIREWIRITDDMEPDEQTKRKVERKYGYRSVK